jgi:hypothetical protein
VKKDRGGQFKAGASIDQPGGNYTLRYIEFLEPQRRDPSLLKGEVEAKV